MCKKVLILSFVCILHVVFSENLKGFAIQNVTKDVILNPNERNAQPEITEVSSLGKNLKKRHIPISSNDQEQYSVPGTVESKTAISNYQDNEKALYSETNNKYNEIQKLFFPNRREQLKKFEESRQKNIKQIIKPSPNISVISPIYAIKNVQSDPLRYADDSNAFDYYSGNVHANKIDEYYLINRKNSKEKYSYNKNKCDMVASTQTVPVFPVVPNPYSPNPDILDSRISYSKTIPIFFNPTLPFPELLPISSPILPIPLVPKLYNHYPPTQSSDPSSPHNRCTCDKGLVINFNSQYFPCFKEKFNCGKKCVLSPRTHLVSVRTPHILFPNENIVTATALISSPYLHQ